MKNVVSKNLKEGRSISQNLLGRARGNGLEKKAPKSGVIFELMEFNFHPECDCIHSCHSILELRKG